MDNLKTLAKASIPVPFAKITPKEPVNKGFTLCKVYVHGCGKNRNYSYMSEEHAKEALPTLSYVPVVGHLMPKYDDDGNQVGYYFGSHDYEVDDQLQLKPMTVPFGVVIDDSFDFEDVEEYGKTVRYLTCNAYLWTGRWPELKEAIYSDDVWFNQSMEITDIQYRPLEEDSNYSEFLSWTYSALCLLGKSDDPEYHTEPCFINAKVEPVKFDLAGEEFSQMMREMKTELSCCFNDDTNQKGGNHLNQEERDAIFAKFAVKAEDVDFEITDDMTAEQLTEKLQEYCDANAAHEGDPEVDSEKPADDNGHEEPDAQVPDTDPVDHDEPEADVADDKPVAFSMSYQARYKELDELCSTLNFTEWNEEDGTCSKERYCWLSDFDDEYVYYNENTWVNGTRDEKQKRCAYSLSEDEGASFTGTPEEVFQRWLTAAEIDQLEADKKQLETLLKFKADTEKAAHDSEMSDLFDQFADVSATEEYASLKEKAASDANFSVADMETQLFALRGKQVKIEKKPSGSIVQGIDPDDKPEDDGYGGLIDRARRNRNRY